MKDNRIAPLLAEIEKLKQQKPADWKRKAKKIMRVIQEMTSEEEFREVYCNADRMGFEQVGRKCRSTRIQPPI